MKKKNIILIILLTIILIFLVYGLLILKKDNLRKTFVQKSDDSVKTDMQNKNPQEEDTNITKQINNNFASDEKITANGDGTQDSECAQMQINYAMINFNKNEICNVNQSDICLNKTIICSIDIKNREIKTSGFFTVELKFTEEDNQSNIIKTNSSRFFISSGQKVKFSDSTNIESTGIDGLANQKFNCFFNTVEIPKKEIC